MSITVVIPVWNGRDDLTRLFASLLRQTRPALEILAVDNGSTDGAPELARERGARVIAMGSNQGFASAVNRGIRQARGDWIAVLNSDVELAPDYFEKLCARDGWFATGKILNRADPSRIDGTYDLVCRGGVAWRAGSGRRDGPAYALPRAIFSPPWTAAVFRSEVFLRAGLLEESFGSYLEDVDFGLRCAALGLSGWYVPEAVAWHRGSASLGRWHAETVRLIARNQRLLVARHFSPDLRRELAGPIATARYLWGALALRHGQPLAWLEGQRSEHPDARRPDDNPELRQHLRENEAEIRRLQKDAGFDWFWRWYFLLTRVESK